MYSDMSRRTIAASVSKSCLGERLRELGLADAGGPRKRKLPTAGADP
jgi:hypothetical protein